MIPLLRAFTSVGYVGRIPGAPGTYGSLVTLPLAYFWTSTVTDNIFLTLLFIVILAGLGIAASNLVAGAMGIEDPGEIVIDEVVGQWIALLAIPNHWGYWLAAFILFRIFDIWKPWLIDKVQKYPGGWGIMLDDVCAGMLAFLLIQGTAAVL
ncbi:MAG: phosphatidylglycerophosphatase A [Candidatus Marinimicrobia bacterium]|nr:phosphatidylglycerophosphatase A [Candidatus Neomarinimicrobiota bacterium]